MAEFIRSDPLQFIALWAIAATLGFGAGWTLRGAVLFKRFAGKLAHIKFVAGEIAQLLDRQVELERTLELLKQERDEMHRKPATRS